MTVVLRLWFAEYEYMADRLGPAGAPQHAARKMLELLKK